MDIKIVELINGKLKNININVFLDENMELIRNLLFKSNIKYYEGFLKYELYYNKKRYTIKTNDTVTNILNEYIPIFNYDEIDKIYIVISNVFNDSKLEKFASITSNKEDEELFKNLSESYLYMSYDDYIYIKKKTLYKMNIHIYNYYKDDIDSYEYDLENKKPDLKKEYNADDKELFEKYLMYKKNFKTFYTNLKYKYIKLKFNFNKTKEMVIKPMNIFNKIQLDNKLFYISVLNEKHTPIIKLYKNNLNKLNEKDIKSWIVYDNKDKNIYKRFNGVIFKYMLNDITNDIIIFNITNNGSIIVKTDVKYDFDYNEMLIKIKNIGDIIINLLNNTTGCIVQDKHLDHIDILNSYALDSMHLQIDINFRINKIFLKDFLDYTYIKKTFLKKDIISEDVVSLFYKKGGIKYSKLKGITVNIQDNFYTENSSTINILGINNLYQVYTLVNKLILISKYLLPNDFEQDTKQHIKTKSSIKELKKYGLDIDSRVCQKAKQPVPGTIPLQGSYPIVYKNKSYICPTTKYPYPGFTRDNKICCFKKDQRNKPIYLANVKTEIIEDFVQPSNLKLKIDNKTVSIIKKEDEYYYIENKELKKIKDINTIEKITNYEKEDQNIWLKVVPFISLITNTSKNYCANLPNLNENDDLKKCKAYPDNQYFGYNINSQPCCFNKERPIITKQTTSPNDFIIKSHIIKADKFVENRRLGELPTFLLDIFGDNFYRIGVFRNSSSFLNSVINAFKGQFGDKIMINSKELKSYIVNTLNEDIFPSLSSGYLVKKYKNIEEFKTQIDNDNVVWFEYIDVIQHIFNVNIHVIEKKNELYNILCIDDSVYISNDRNIVLIRYYTENHFECLYDKVNNTSLFTKDDDIVKLFDKFKNKSCLKEESVPDNYQFKLLYKLSELIDMFENTIYKFVCLIENTFSKIDYVLINNGMIIPIKEVNKTDIKNGMKILTMRSIEKNFITIEDYNRKLQKLKSNIPNFNLEILGVSVDKNNNINALMTNYGFFVPLKKSKYTSEYTKLPYRYYENINNILSNKNTFDDKAKKYAKNIEQTKEAILSLKTMFAKRIIKSENENNKKQIMDIVLDKKLQTFNKIVKIEQIMRKVLNLENNDRKAVEFFIKKVALEIIYDNIDFAILNNNINSKLLESNPNEIVFTSLYEIKAYFDNMV